MAVNSLPKQDIFKHMAIPSIIELHNMRPPGTQGSPEEERVEYSQNVGRVTIE